MKDYDEMEVLLENLEQMQWQLKNVREAINTGDSLLSEINQMSRVLEKFNDWCEDGWIEENNIEITESEEEIPAYILDNNELLDVDNTIRRIKNKFQKFKVAIKDMSKSLVNNDISESYLLKLEDEGQWVEHFKVEIFSKKIQYVIAEIMDIVYRLGFKLKEIIDEEKQIRNDNNMIMSNLINQEYKAI